MKPPKTLSLASMPQITRQMKEGFAPVAKEAYVYGSLAHGAAVPWESDADVLVVPKRKINLDEVYSRINETYTSLIAKGLVLHVILYRRGMERLLAEARKGVRIV